MPPEAEQFFSYLVLEPGNKSHRYQHGSHTERCSQYGQPDDERREGALLPQQVTSRYEKR